MQQTKATERAEKYRFWKEELEKWQASGVTQAEYCRANALRVNQFCYWKKQILSEPISGCLVEVPLSGAANRSPLTLVVNDRYRIELETGFDPMALTGLIQVLTRL